MVIANSETACPVDDNDHQEAANIIVNEPFVRPEELSNNRNKSKSHEL